MNIKPTLLYLFGLLTLLAWQSCKEDLTVDNSDKNFPLTLNHQQTDDGLEFSWPAANVSGFEKYVLLRSTDSIPAGITPSNNFGTTQIVYSPDHRDSTRFKDNAPPIATHLYYKLYLKSGDRFLESANVRIDQDVLSFLGSATAVKFLPDSSWIFMFDNSFGQMLLLDYKNNRILAQRAQIQFPINGVNSCEFGLEGNQPVMYVASAFGEFHVLSLPSLATLRVMTTSSSTNIFSFQPNDNGVIYMQEYDYTNSFTVRRASDLSIIENYTRSNYYNFRDLLLLDKGTGRLMENSYDALSLYNANAMTGEVTNLISGPSAFNGNQTFDATKSPDGKLFIPNQNGLIYQADNLQTFGTVPNSVGLSVVDYSFSRDGEHIYAAYNGFSTTVVVKYHLPDLVQENIIEIQNFTPLRIQGLDGHSFVFFGQSAFSSSDLVVKKYNF